jgi:alkylation response protein AidB-like acyl-CoA dehydrogenase
VIIAFGTPAQQQYFLPRILSGEHWWCQGYSEPGSGSDLASLKMRAEKHGDHYVVNGQKTWNTLGQYADWIFCLVRTNPDARQQDGISFLLIDMKSPGITVRPIRCSRADTNHDIPRLVKVPVGRITGETRLDVAKFLLGTSGGHRQRRSKKLLERLKRSHGRGSNGRPEKRAMDRIAQID